jgi:hypothetical protein
MGPKQGALKKSNFTKNLPTIEQLLFGQLLVLFSSTGGPKRTKKTSPYKPCKVVAWLSL